MPGIRASFQAEVFRAALRNPFEPAFHDRRVAISQRLRQVFSKRGRDVLARVAGVNHRGVQLPNLVVLDPAEGVRAPGVAAVGSAGVFLHHESSRGARASQPV